MFSFFRKGRPSPPPATLPAEDVDFTAAVSQASASDADAAMGETAGIQVQETDIELAADIEEAVMLYASGRSDDAIAALQRYLHNHPDSSDPLPWRMLFDAYEATGQRQPFDELAMDFALRLERSPPTWSPAQSGSNGNLPAAHPVFAFAAGFSPQDRARWQHFLEEAQTAADLALDFTLTPIPSEDAPARAIQACVADVVSLGKEIRVIGGDAFLVRLNAARADGRLAEAGWLVLLAVQQLLGRGDDYEATALEFAVRFEISPPSYVPRHKPATPVAEPGAHFAGETAFAFRGVIGPGTTDQLADLKDFATDRARVEIDLSRVIRIDFGVTGLLLETLIALDASGKKVCFRDGNELVTLMLQLLGAGQYATIVQRKRN